VSALLKRRWLIVAGGVIAGAAAITTALAQSANGLDLSWHAFGGGGDASSGNGAYQLRSVTGQTFTGTSSNGPYSVSSGFLVGQGSKVRRFVPIAKD
jgi:hypothetical protein